ncbi:MAG: alkaline phosphatase family protein [Myxococcales bacterium]|nr:alkaline phosphatase family protein [Myxococcales bacterium]
MAKPDYDGGGLVNLMASLRAGLGAGACAYPELALLPGSRLSGARTVVLLLIDGLGAAYFERHARSLQGHQLGSITSVFPSATAPTITTLLTGTAPQQHAVTGWHMHLRELGTVAAILPFRARWGGPPLSTAGVAVAPLLGAPALTDELPAAVTYISPANISDSAFNTALAASARRVPFADTTELFSVLQREIGAPQEKRRRYIYAYWPGFDAVCHAFGTESEFALAHFHELETGIEALISALRGSDTQLMVTADHGFVDLGDGDCVDLGDHPELADCLALPLCGEPRAAFCHLREGQARRFERYVAKHLDSHFECIASDALIEEGWLGRGRPDARLRDRLGDYVLIGRDNRIIRDALPHQQPPRHIGVHGGCHSDEMYVPLLLSEC